MATKPFHYQEMFPLGPDTTEYYHLTSEYVKTENWGGHEFLVVDPEALTVLARQATHDNAFMLRREHNEMVAKILSDPEASDNDKFVALTMLRNAEVAAKGQLPFCQDTGTAIIHGEKGQLVYTGGNDEEKLSKGVYDTYTTDNLRYSQNAPLNMYDEVNTGCNLPAQIDIHATEGNEYHFVFVAKGGGSANKTYLYQETKAIINPKTLVPFLVEKMKTLGTAACPPYHIAFVIGGTSAEKNLETVKKASIKYYDNLPTKGNEYGHAFRDIELENELKKASEKIGLGAQFGGKYFAHDIRVIRLPRHGASCPIGMGVSCSADRNIKAKINREGLWLEKLDANPGELIPEELRKEGEGNVVKIDLNRPMSEVLAELDKFPVATRLSLSACQDQGASRRRRAYARIPQEPSDLLCRPRQDTDRHGFRIVRSYNCRTYGPLCRPVPESGRLHDNDSQRQPQPAGNRCMQGQRRLLSRQHRRSRRNSRKRFDQEGRASGISRARYGSYLENRG